MRVLRVLVADDGSSDATAAIAERAGAPLDRLGGLQPAHGGAGLGEDTWLAWRARRAGARTAALTHRSARPRESLEYVEDATALRALPATVAGLPELRDTLLHRRVFLSTRSMQLDLALAGMSLAAALLHGSAESRTLVI